MKQLIIIGAGGHGRVIADIAQKLGVYETISFWMTGKPKKIWACPSLERRPKWKNI